MNRIMFTARMAKGLSEKKAAEKLKITETQYKEIELEISPVNPEIAEALETLYKVPAYFFNTGNSDNIQTGIKALEKHKEIIDKSPDFQNISIPAHTHISIAKMGFDALIAKQEQILLLMQIRELTIENESLKKLYEAVKAKNAVKAMG